MLVKQRLIEVLELRSSAGSWCTDGSEPCTDGSELVVHVPGNPVPCSSRELSN